VRELPNSRFATPNAARLGEIYSRTAAFYDDVAAAHQAAAKDLALDLLARRQGERFLEAGVGTGWAFLRAIQRSGAGRAAGLELATGMLDVARQRLAAYRPLDLVLGDARALPFANAAFDCLLSTYTLEVMLDSDIAAALAEFHRVLRPGGRAVIADLTPGEGEDAAITDEWLRGYTADPEYYGGARPIRLVPLLEAAGFTAGERRYVGHGASWPSEVVLAQRTQRNRHAAVTRHGG
jgi:ubiquinone/menaquinone biosynthesis C-methylase UbiE